MLGHVACGEEDYATARSLYEKCIKLCRAIGDRLMLPSVIQDMCMAMMKCGEYDGVAALLEMSLLLYQEQGIIFGAVEALTVFAYLAVAQGLAERAMSLAGAAVSNYRALSKRLFPRQLADFERTQATARQMLGPQAAAVAWKKGQAMTLEQAIAYALAKPPA
jgi:hypothetical protein